MKKVWIKRLRSFKESDKFDAEYYSKMTGAERIEIMQLLREAYGRMKGGLKRAGRKRLRRLIKVA